MINLATQPFRNERLAALLLALVAAGALVVTVAHAAVAVRLVRHGARHEEVRRVEREVAALRAESSRLRVAPPDRATLARWSAVRDLVDKRVFSWTRLFQQLETTLPRQVRLLSLSPKVTKGNVTIGMNAVANPPGVGLELIDTLEQQGPFSDVYPISNRRTEAGEEEYEYELRYRQPALMVAAAPAASPSPSPSPSAVEPEAADDGGFPPAEER